MNVGDIAYTRLLDAKGRQYGEPETVRIVGKVGKNRFVVSRHRKQFIVNRVDVQTPLEWLIDHLEV